MNSIVIMMPFNGIKFNAFYLKLTFGAKLLSKGYHFQVPMKKSGLSDQNKTENLCLHDHDKHPLHS